MPHLQTEVKQTEKLTLNHSVFFVDSLAVPLDCILAAIQNS